MYNVCINGKKITQHDWQIIDVNPPPPERKRAYPRDRAECCRRLERIYAVLGLFEAGLSSEHLAIDANLVEEARKQFDALLIAAGQKKSA